MQNKKPKKQIKNENNTMPAIQNSSLELFSNFVIFQTEKGKVNIDVFFKDESLWLTQKLMAELFEVNVPAISKHMKNIFETNELQEKSVISILETTAKDGKKYKTKYYNLKAITAVGYRINSHRATEFRKWATEILHEYIVKGFAMDDERLKQIKHLADGVVHSPPLEGWQPKADGVVHSPPLEGWSKTGVVHSPLKKHKQTHILRNSKNYFNLPYNPKLKERARALRKAGNLSEVLFWKRVNKKQFKSFDFDRQKIIGNYIVDFYNSNCQVVIEIDGSSHDDKQDYDEVRDVYLKSLGLTVIHITVKDVLQNLDNVMKMLFDHPAFRVTIKRRGDHPALSGTSPEEGNLVMKQAELIANDIITDG